MTLIGITFFFSNLSFYSTAESEIVSLYKKGIRKRFSMENPSSKSTLYYTRIFTLYQLQLAVKSQSHSKHGRRERRHVSSCLPASDSRKGEMSLEGRGWVGGWGCEER